MEINLYRELNFLYCIYASELPSVSSLYFILYINFWTKSSSHKLGGEDSLFLQHSSSTRVRRGQVVLTHSANIISPYCYKERHTTPRLNIISSPRGSSDRSPCSPAWGISVKIQDLRDWLCSHLWPPISYFSNASSTCRNKQSFIFF